MEIVLSHRRLRERLILKFLGLTASLVFIIALFGITRADTDISGTISSNTTLGPTSPNFTQDTVYVVTGTVTVNAGVTLTIQPGVTLRFNSATGLNVNGVLDAQGAAGPPEQRIRFTRSGASGNWNGMTLSGAGTNASVLSRCDIEFAGQSERGIWFNDSSATMSESTVTNSSGTGVWIRGANANPTLTNVTVSNNTYGVVVDGNGRVTLTGCTIQNNSETGVNAFSSGSEAPTIQNCTISGNNTANNGSGGGVRVGILATVTGNAIQNNNRVGVRVENGSDVPLIQNNVIQNNTSYPLSFAANPLTNAAARITGNTFSGNTPNDRAEMRGGTLSVNTTWMETVNGLGLDVNGYYTVATGATLTILPGQTLFFGSGGRLEGISGNIVAQGAAGPPEQRIRFTRRATSGVWDGIRLSGTATNASVFSRCDIELGRYFGIWFENSSATMSESTVTNNAQGVYISGANANPTLTNVTISDNWGNGGYGVRVDGGGGTLTGCTIQNNRLSGVYSANGAPTIQNCTISGNNIANNADWGGVAVGRLATVTGNVIQNNNGVGVVALNDTDVPIIQNNTIQNNSRYPLAFQANPLTNAAARITGNTFSGNTPNDRAEIQSGTLTVDTTWVERVNAPSGQPNSLELDINGTYTVGAGATLTILPGQTLFFGPTGNLRGNTGNIVAQGAAGPPEQRIRFTRRATSGGWFGIRLDGSGTNASVFSRCDIEFAANPGVWFAGSSATMSESTVTNCSGDGVWITGSSSNSTLTNVTCNANRYGVAIWDHGRGTLNGCTMQNNWLGGVLAFSRGDEVPTIQNCTISGNNTSNDSNSGGIIVGRLATVTGNTIQNNRRAGVRVENDTDVPLIQNNTIQNNDGYAISVGINPLTNAGTRITGNTITGNNPNRVGFRGGALAANYTWVDTVQGLPVDVTGTVTVNTNITLTFTPGQLVTFGPGANISANGGVVQAVGTPEPFSPIIFTSNAANPTPGSWGGFVISGAGSSASQFNYCVISFSGYGINCTNASPTVTNCTIVSCSSTAINISGTSNPVIDNSILANNAGFGVRAVAPATATVTYSDAFANAQGNFSGVTPGTGVIQSDPRFRSATDLHLQAASPCINTGDPAVANDADNTPSDMGAFPHLGPGFVSINPTSGSQGQSNIAFTITGVNLTDTNEIRFLLNGNPDPNIAVSNISVVNDNQVTATLNVASGAAVGNRVVQVVSTTRGTSNVAFGPTFAVSAAAIPIINSISPNVGQQAARIQTFAINGTNMTGVTAINFLLSGSNDANVTVSNINVVNDTQVTAQVDIDIAAAVGNRVVTATNAFGTSSSTEGDNNRFTINPPPLVVNSINPTQGRRNDVNVAFTINGTAFTGATDVRFLFNGNNDAEITHGALMVNGLGTQITTTINVGANAQPGDHVVVVVTPGGDSSSVATAGNTFTVLPPPSISSINPTTGVQGQNNVPIEIIGLNLTGTSAITFLQGGNPDPNIAVSNITVTNDTKVTAMVSIGENAQAGDRVVTATTPNGTSSAAAGVNNTFTVTPAAPQVTQVDPNQGQRGMTLDVTVTGKFFQTGATVNFGAGVTINSAVVNSSTQITANLTIDGAATLGARNVMVTNPDTQSGTLNNGFTVAAPPPTITAVSLPNAAQGQSNLTLTIDGTNLTDTSAIVFLLNNNPDPNITVSNITVVSDTQVTATVDISANAQPGDRVITVTTPGGTTSSAGGVNNTIVIAAAVPSVTNVNPNQGAAGTTADVTMTGMFFQIGATVNFGSGITVNTITVNSSTQITVNVTIAANAAEGARDVTVTNPDTRSGTLTNGFTVTSAAPVINSVSLPNATPGASNLTLTIVGVNLAGANVINLLFGGNPDPNITVSNIVVNDTQITAIVSINRNASAGDRIVRVTTPGGTADSATPVTVQVTLPTIPGGGNRFFMRSVPVNAANLDPLTVFGQNAQVARYAGNNQYQFSNFFIALGEGYFVRLPADFTPALTSGTLAPHAPFDIALPDNDWFILGNPFLGAVNVDVNQWQVVIGGVATPLANFVGDVNGAVTFYGWTWNSDRNDYDLVCDPNVIPGAVSMLGVGEAMYVRTRRANVMMRLPVPAAHPQLARKTQRKRNANDWSFRLATTAGGAVDANTYLGVTSQGNGQGVKVEMPPVLLARQGYVETSIINDATRNTSRFIGILGKPEQYAIRSETAQRWKADLRPAAGQREEWTIEVRTDQRNADVTLNWNDLSHVPRQYRLRLTDLTTGEKRAMRTVGGYTFRSNPDGDTVRRFRVELYPASEGSLRVRNLNVVAQNGPGAHVSFMLSQPARVQMTVLSPTGKAVRTLPPMEAKTGLNALVWDGKSQTGAELGRGLYLVLVRAVDEEGQETQATRSIVIR